MSLPPTPGQTVGPFFHDALPFPGGPELVAAGTPGAVVLHGRVLDGEGAGIPDALVEVWQADPDGHPVRRPGSLHRDGRTFTGWGRAATDPDGRYVFTTLPPGAVDGGLPFFAVTVFARGLLDRLFTRAYLPLGGAEPDAVLRAAGGRGATMICEADGEGWAFDVVLQGEDETVFLTYPGHSPS